MGEKIRLYLDQAFGAGQTVPVSADQAHYLFGVMRLSEGATIGVFNGRHGEWRAEVTEAKKRGGAVTLPRTDPPAARRRPTSGFSSRRSGRRAPTSSSRRRWSLASRRDPARQPRASPTPNASAATGCRPMRSRPPSNAARPSCPRWPTSCPSTASWPAGPTDRQLVFCDEARAGTVSDPSAALTGAPAAILIGPEGGFAEEERARLTALPQAVSLSLAPASCAPTPPPWRPSRSGRPRSATGRGARHELRPPRGHAHPEPLARNADRCGRRGPRRASRHDLLRACLGHRRRRWPSPARFSPLPASSARASGAGARGRDWSRCWKGRSPTSDPSAAAAFRPTTCRGSNSIPWAAPRQAGWSRQASATACASPSTPPGPRRSSTSSRASRARHRGDAQVPRDAPGRRVTVWERARTLLH